jgi:hypothetical protein
MTPVKPRVPPSTYRYSLAREMPSIRQILGTELALSAARIRSCRNFRRSAHVGHLDIPWLSQLLTRVRSLIRSRLNPAEAPKTWDTSLPPLLTVSNCTWVREHLRVPVFVYVP